MLDLSLLELHLQPPLVSNKIRLGLAVLVSGYSRVDCSVPLQLVDLRLVLVQEVLHLLLVNLRELHTHNSSAVAM